MRALLLSLLAATLVLIQPGVAAAHALLVESKPAHGAVLKQSPEFVELRFNEPVEAEFTPLTVRSRTGARVDAGDARVLPENRTVVRVGLKPLADGLYTVVYRVTSADGHPVQGTIAFAVGEGTQIELAEAEQQPIGVPAYVGLVRGLGIALALMLAGLAGFMVLVWRPVWPAALPGLRHWAVALGGLFLAVTLVEVVVYAVRASGEPLSLDLVGQTLTRTRVGRLLTLRMGVGLLAAGALPLAHNAASRWARYAALVPGALLLLTFSLQSHAAAFDEWLPLAADWVHLLAAAAWAGGLVGFALAAWPVLRPLTREQRELHLTRAVPLFSRMAVTAVALLLVTGLYGSLLHIKSWEGLVTTAYGWSLLAKLALLVPLLGLGAYHFKRKGAGTFRQTVLAEVALMAGVVLAAGLLTTQIPAQVAVIARLSPFEQTALESGLQIRLRIAPNRVGYNQPTVTLTRNGAPEQGAGVTILATMVGHDMGVQNLSAREQAPGVYQPEQLVLGMDGPWQVQVSILTKEGRELRHSFVVTVPPPIMP